MNWDEISDDEFVEEAQRRVNAGRWSPDRYMSQLQSDDRGKLDALRGAISSLRETNPYHDGIAMLGVLCDKLDSFRGNPLPKPAYAVNTTLPGREDRYDTHQSELES